MESDSFVSSVTRLSSLWNLWTESQLISHSGPLGLSVATGAVMVAFGTGSGEYYQDLEPPSGELLHTLTGHSQRVFLRCLNPDGQTSPV